MNWSDVFRRKNITWTAEFEYTKKLFVGFLQVFSDKVATILDSYALVVYPVHGVLQNYSTQFRRWLIANSLALIILFAESSSTRKKEEKHGKHGSHELYAIDFHL